MKGEKIKNNPQKKQQQKQNQKNQNKKLKTKGLEKMNLLTFSIYDEKAKTFSKPFFMPSMGLALRALNDIVDDPQTSLAKYPQDFKLYNLGSFDDNKGEFIGVPQPVFIAHATDYIKKNHPHTDNGGANGDKKQ